MIPVRAIAKVITVAAGIWLDYYQRERAEDPPLRAAATATRVTGRQPRIRRLMKKQRKGWH